MKNKTSTAAGAPASRNPGGAKTTGGAVGAVATAPQPERRSHEGKQQLELKSPSGIQWAS
jgi:hypothetical protein